MARIKFPLIFLLQGLILLCLLSSCRKNNAPAERGIYYWKTNFSLSPAETQKLHSFHINKIYLRLFDVDWDNGSNSPVPKGEIKFANKPDRSIIIVPVVYITNKTLLNLKQSAAPLLSEKLFRQINHIMNSTDIPFTEAQLDCDWTEKTKEIYFSLIKNLKDKLIKENKIISATIRLHQIKYPEMTGIPPVDRGMLMFYNMGKINSRDDVNSIYNYDDAVKYVSGINNYPLQLDAALPLFGWIVHSRNGDVLDLINESMINDLPEDKRFTLWGKNSYVSNDNFFLHGYYFIKGDMLKVENADIELCRKAAELVSRNIKHNNKTVSLFDYDSLKFSNYYEKDFEKLFGLFN